MKIRPVSDLRNYANVLKDCEGGEPVYLTKNGKGAFVIQDIREFQKQRAIFTLMQKLAEADECTEFYTAEEVKKSLGLL